MFFNNLIKIFLISAIFIAANAAEPPRQELQKGTTMVVQELYTQQCEALSNTSLFFFITAWNQERFAPNLATSLRLNYDRLSEKRVDFQIRLTCDGRQEDFDAFSDAFSKAFADSGIPSENYKIDLNPKNLGVSRTRFNQLENANKEISSLLKAGKHVYFSIFDGDDVIHQDYCLLLLAAALKEDADVIGTSMLSVSETDFSIDSPDGKISVFDLQRQNILKKQVELAPFNRESGGCDLIEIKHCVVIDDTTNEYTLIFL